MALPPPPALPFDPTAPDAVLADQVGAAADIPVPEAAIAGVAANARLLARHLAVLEQEMAVPA